MGFKEDLLNCSSVKEQQQVIYNYAIKQGPPTKFYTITSKLPNGTSVTYQVMPDYFSIDGVRASMTAATAQTLANTWGLVLPTAKMTEQIFHEAKQLGGAIAPTPLSGSGYKDPATGKVYTGQQVVNTQIGAPGASVAYNQKVDEAVEKAKAPLYAGHGKTIIQADPKKIDRLNFIGIERVQGDKVVPIQPRSNPHAYDSHSEYITFARFIKNTVNVTTPDGQSKQMTVQELLSDPELYKSVSDTKGYYAYNTPKTSQTSSTQADMKSKQNITSMNSIWSDRQQRIYKQARTIPALQRLEILMSQALDVDLSGKIVNQNKIETDLEDIKKSAYLCAGYLKYQGKISQAQAVLDAVDLAYKDDRPSATSFVVPRDVTQTALFQPTESQQIGRSQIDPPKSGHHQVCDHCGTTIENIYLLDSANCPTCKKSLEK